MDFSRRSDYLSPPSSDRRRSQNLPSVSSYPRTSPNSSASTTSYPSPTNDSAASAPSQLHTSFPLSFPQKQIDAPLPSPSANDFDPFFGLPQSQTSNSYLAQPSEGQPSQQNPTMQQPQTSHQQSSYSTQQQAAQENNPYLRRGGLDDPAAAAPFLKDFNLIAEAAKRAQIACVMRDLEGVSI